MTVAVPLVVVETDASQSRGEVGGRLEGGQEVVVQLEPVEASQGGEGGGGHFRYLALGEVEALEVLTITRLLLEVISVRSHLQVVESILLHSSDWVPLQGESHQVSAVLQSFLQWGYCKTFFRLNRNCRITFGMTWIRL